MSDKLGEYAGDVIAALQTSLAIGEVAPGLSFAVTRYAGYLRSHGATRKHAIDLLQRFIDRAAAHPDLVRSEKASRALEIVTA